MRAVIDTCVVIDALEAREPFSDDAEKIMLAAADGKFEGVMTSVSILDIYRLIRHVPQAKGHTAKLLRLFEVCAVTREDEEKAVLSETEDFEAAVASETAKRAGAEYIVTRDIDDFSHSEVEAVTPEDFLKILHKEK